MWSHPHVLDLKSVLSHDTRVADATYGHAESPLPLGTQLSPRVWLFGLPSWSYLDGLSLVDSSVEMILFSDVALDQVRPLSFP